MSRAIVLRRLALQEFNEAADWYERKRGGRGARFTAAVGQVLDVIAATPELYAEVDTGVREAPVKKHPYCVYYRVEPSQIVVLSIFHTSRDPNIWKGRY